MASNFNFGGFVKLRKRVEDLAKLRGKAGWPTNAQTKKGTKIVDIATSQEYGTPKGAPPRAFMRTAIAENERKWIKHLQTGTQACLHGSTSAQTVFSNTAHMAVNDIKQSIKRTAPSSQKDKASKSPNQTGLLIQTLTSEVEPKSGA